MSYRTIDRAVLVSVVVALLAPPALAEYSAPTWNGTGRIWNNYLYSRPAREALRKRAPAGQPAARSPGSTTFTMGAPVVLDTVPPAQRAQVSKLLSSCRTVYERMMAQAGGLTNPLVLNDLATSTTFYVMVAHYLYWNGQPGALPDLQPRQVQGLRVELRDRFLATGAFARQSDSQKQLAHDSMILTACVPLVQLTEARKSGNETARKALRPQGTRLLAEVGLTPTSLQLSPDGRVLIGKD